MYVNICSKPRPHVQEFARSLVSHLGSVLCGSHVERSVNLNPEDDVNILGGLLNPYRLLLWLLRIQRPKLWR